MKHTLSICLLTSALTLWPWLTHSAAAQANDPDSYLRRLATLDTRAAQSARLECFNQRSLERTRYNECLRAAFLAAGGPSSAPPVRNALSVEPSAHPQPGLNLDELAGPNRRALSSRLNSSLDCPTENECAVTLGAFSSVEMGHQKISAISNRLPELTAPFSTSVRAPSTPNTPNSFQAAFINGTRTQARELCEAIRSTGENCSVARQVYMRNHETTTRPAPHTADNTQGSSRVQIGAFTTPDIAHSQLEALSSRFEQYTLNVKTSVEAVTLPNGDIRFRASFMGLTHFRATNFCNAIKENNGTCIVR